MYKATGLKKSHIQNERVHLQGGHKILRKLFLFGLTGNKGPFIVFHTFFGKTSDARF